LPAVFIRHLRVASAKSSTHSMSVDLVNVIVTP
jgi:hypothetical protein